MRGSAVFRTGVAPGGALAGPWVQNSLWTRARAVPSLDLRFADNKSLVDATTGAQLVTFTRASSGTYVDSEGVIRTATTNLLLRSEEFDVTWNKPAGVTVTANTTEAPNGTQTADTLSGAINVSHNSTNLSQAITATESTSYTFSIYVKSLTSTTFSIRLRDNTADSQSTTITPTSSWQRVSCTLTTGIGATSLVARVGNANGDVAIWGAQLEQSATVGEYIPTTSTINSAPRFDHDPTTGESLGLLVEESRTNLILQSENLSTTWTNVNTSEAINVATAPDGTTTADKLITNNGVASVSSYITQTVAKSAAATTYTYSVFAKTGDTGIGTVQLLAVDTALGANRATTIFSTVTGTIPNPASVNGTFTNASSIITPLADGWYRCSLTFTTGTETSISLRLYSRLPTTGDGSSGLLSFATSYITTTAAVTRAADVASITGSNFSSWYRQDEGTVFAEFVPRTFAQACGLLSLDDGTTSERLQTRLSTNGNGALVVADGGSVQANFSTVASTSLNTKGRLATSFAVNSFKVSLNGGSVASDTSGTLPTVAQAVIGNAVGAFIFNGPISRIAFWPRELPESTLQTITQ
jgi:hypothetical protein